MGNPQALLCRYVYDALDRLTGLVPSGQAELQRFYNIERLATELQGRTSRTVFQQDTQLLALQQRQDDEISSQLLATDQQFSVLHTVASVQHPPKAYTPYGHRRAESGLSNLLGFNGERPDPVTGHYLLGNGHRAFNPVLMRFNNPDRLSPFGRGGLNPYVYCVGDPVNRRDPGGRFSILGIAGLLTSVGSLGSSSVGLLPSLSFLDSSKALFAGAIGRLPGKYSFGAISSVVAGTTGVLGAVSGVTRVVIGETDPDSSAQEMLTWISLGFGAISLAAKLGSYWVARDPKAALALKGLVEKPSGPVAVRSSLRSRPSIPSSHRSSTRLPTPDLPQASASPPTTVQFLMEQLDRQAEIFKNAKRIRRNTL